MWRQVIWWRCVLWRCQALNIFCQCLASAQKITETETVGATPLSYIRSSPFTDLWTDSSIGRDRDLSWARAISLSPYKSYHCTGSQAPSHSFILAGWPWFPRRSRVLTLDTRFAKLNACSTPCFDELSSRQISWLQCLSLMDRHQQDHLEFWLPENFDQWSSAFLFPPGNWFHGRQGDRYITVHGWILGPLLLYRRHDPLLYRWVLNIYIGDVVMITKSPRIDQHGSWAIHTVQRYSHPSDGEDVSMWVPVFGSYRSTPGC